MSSENLIPENPLGFIQRCVQEKKLLWTYHVNMRMESRSIPRQMILDAVQNYKIIATYPKDKYLLSYLILSKYQDTILHILFAADIKENNVRIITAYHPSLDEWHDDFETRR
jgi:hypothetical protein